MSKVILLFLLGFICCNNSDRIIVEKDYSSRHAQALAYCKENDFSQEYYFLIDMSIHSGRNRFFVYDFRQNKVTDKKLVTHGSCDQFELNSDKWKKVKFSSKVDSHCSMKGKYRIGGRDYSKWGINVKYWLEGLESTNKTAVQRVVVLHSWDAVSDAEIYPDYSPLSWGCPAVSDAFMEQLDAKLKQAKKPVLLWITE
jgi:hypothetical protein